MTDIYDLRDVNFRGITWQGQLSGPDKSAVFAAQTHGIAAVLIDHVDDFLVNQAT